MPNLRAEFEPIPNPRAEHYVDVTETFRLAINDLATIAQMRVKNPQEFARQTLVGINAILISQYLPT